MSGQSALYLIPRRKRPRAIRTKGFITRKLGCRPPHLFRISERPPRGYNHPTRGTTFHSGCPNEEAFEKRYISCREHSGTLRVTLAQAYSRPLVAKPLPMVRSYGLPMEHYTTPISCGFFDISPRRNSCSPHTQPNWKYSSLAQVLFLRIKWSGTQRISTIKAAGEGLLPGGNWGWRRGHGHEWMETLLGLWMRNL